MEPGAELSEED